MRTTNKDLERRHPSERISRVVITARSYAESQLKKNSAHIFATFFLFDDYYFPSNTTTHDFNGMRLKLLCFYAIGRASRSPEALAV